MLDLERWKVNNLVIELRFAPSPYFFKNRNEIIENLYVKFPNYDFKSANVPGPMVMHTENNPGISLNIFPNKLAVIFEQFDNLDLIHIGKDACKSIIEILKIISIQRFGMRINMIKRMELIDADKILNSFINNKFDELDLINSSCILNLTGSEDVNLRISLNRGMSQTVQIGLNSNIQQEPVSGLAVDIDVSKNDVKGDDIISFIDNGLREYEKCQSVIG